MTDVHVLPATALQGELLLPGDKSVSHRALLLGLLGSGSVRIDNLAVSADVDSTASAIEQLGAKVERDAANPTRVTVTGVGMRGLRASEPIDAGNAGTLARLLTGILAGQPAGAEFTIVGDDSLSGRPMGRITSPLREMGAQIEAAEGETLPLIVRGGADLEGIEYKLGVASAQVQSAILLAGLYASTPTTVHEPAVLRDHTERMLRRAGVKVTRKRAAVTVEPTDELQLPDTRVPADPSAAAPIITAATLLRDSLVRLPGVMMNPGRTGYLDLLQSMGARIAVLSRDTLDGEPIAHLEIEHADLGRAVLPFNDVPRMIDELPFLGLAAHFCRGETRVRNAAELRVKESDRIATIVLALRRIGINAEELSDGFIVRGSGKRPEGGEVNAAGDHRIAMLGGIAGLVSQQGVTVLGADCVDVSFPGFFDVLARMAVRPR